MSQNVFEKCKNCISKLREIYGRSPIPEGFIPNVSWESFYESKNMKEEPTSDPTFVVTRDFALVKRDSSAFIQR